MNSQFCGFGKVTGKRFRVQKKTLGKLLDISPTWKAKGGGTGQLILLEKYSELSLDAISLSCVIVSDLSAAVESVPEAIDIMPCSTFGGSSGRFGPKRTY